MYTFRDSESHDFCTCHSTFLSVHFPCKKTKLEHFFFRKEQETEAEVGRIVKERIKISHSTQGSRSRGNTMIIHGNIIDVRISSRCCWCWGDCDPRTRGVSIGIWSRILELKDPWASGTIFSVAHCVMFSAPQARFFDFPRFFFYFFGAAGPIFCFLPVLTFCLAYYQPWVTYLLTYLLISVTCQKPCCFTHWPGEDIYMYVYIERERERERESNYRVYVCVCIPIYR